MSAWFYAVVFVMIVAGIVHAEHTGYVKGMKATAIALEPHLCK